MVDSATRPATTGRTGFAAPSVAPQRTRRARWKDGRLILGVLLVAVTALVGARLLSTADDTVLVWSAKKSIPAGTALGADDLTGTRVRFADGDAAERYAKADVDLVGSVTLRQIGAGELVARDATASRRESDRTELPLSVAGGRLPADLAVGDEVDVWVVPKAAGGKERPPATRVWEAVQVIDVDAVKGAAAGSSSRRQVLVALEPKHVGKLGQGLGNVVDGEPVLVRRSR